VSLELPGGSITGMAGMVGSGRTELALALFGALPLGGGSIEIGGRTYRRMNPAQAIALGVGLVTEDPRAKGLRCCLISPPTSPPLR
jgi:ribose transport system ATP-binding protein